MQNTPLDNKKNQLAMELHQAEDAVITTVADHRNLIDYMQNGYAYCRVTVEEGCPVDFIHEEVNAGYEKITGLINVVGKSASELFPGVSVYREELIAKYNRIVKAGIPERFEMYLEPFNKWFDISVYSPTEGYFAAVFDDITQRMLTRETLKQSEDRFEMLFKEHSSIMLVIDADTGNIIDANLAAEDFYGWSIDALKQMNIRQINMHSPEQVRYDSDSLRLLGHYTFTMNHKRADGSIRAVEVVSNAVILHDKVVFYSIINDITERKQSEKALKKSEERFRRLFESHSAVMMILDPETGQIMDANKAAANFYGWPIDELRQMCIQQITNVPPEAVKSNMQKVRTSEQNQFTFRHRRENGTLCDVEVFSNTIEIDGKELLYAIIHDVTERRNAEKALNESEARFRRLFEEHSAIMLIIDPDTGCIMNANRAASNFYGWSIEELCRMRIQQIYSLEENEGKEEIEESNPLTESHASSRHRRMDGSIRVVDVFSNSIEIGGKKLIYSIIHDITDRKRYESLTEFRLRILQMAETHSLEELLMATLDNEGDEKSIKSLFEAFPESMFLMDCSGKILVANKTFVDKFSKTKPNIIGTDIYSILPKEFVVELKKRSEEVLVTGERVSFEEELHDRIYRNTIYPIPNKEGEITKLLIFRVDMTTLNLSENELLDHRVYYRNLFNNMVNGFAYCRVIYENGRAVDYVHEVVNLNFKKITGLEELEGRKMSEVIPDNSHSTHELIERLGKVAQNGVAERFEFYIKALKKTFDITAYSHQKGYFVVVLRPIKIINTGTWEWSLDTGEMIWSDEFRELYSLDTESVQPSYQAWMKTSMPSERNQTEDAIREAVAKGSTFNVISHVCDSQGTVRQLMTQGFAVRNDDGHVKRYMGISVDITEYKHNDNKHVITTNNITSLMHSTMESLCLIGIDGAILDANKDFVDNYSIDSIDSKDLKGHNFHNLFQEELQEERKGKFELIFITGEPIHFKDKSSKKNEAKNQGKEDIYQISAYPVVNENKKIVSLAVFITNLNENSEAEKARKLLDKQYQTLISASPDSIITTSLSGIITSVSDIGLEIFGTSNKADVIGMPFSRIVYSDNISIIDTIFDVTLREGLIQNKEILLKKKNNTIYSAEISAALIQDYNGAPSSYMLIIRDISQRKIIESELFHAKRLTSLGEMASGIAHEIYQPINNIGLIVDKLLMNASKNKWSCEKEIKSKSEKIFENVLRVQTIIDNIRSFTSTDNNYVSSVLNVNKSIRNALLMISEKCKNKFITLSFKEGEERLIVTGNIYKFEQVILNLIRNSIDALEEKKQINVQTLNTDGFEMKIQIHSYSLNDSVVVSVADNGIGIKENNIDYIMHPFYTTKESGKGTGLGLSISYGIIQEMNGDIKIKSDHINGTRVIITLPKIIKKLKLID